MGLVKRWAFFDNSFRLNKKNISDSKVLKIQPKQINKIKQKYLNKTLESLKIYS